MEQTPISESAPYWWGLIPALDGQTIVSILIGVVVTFVTFAIGYRQTIGARDERVRAANIALASSVLRRIAVERQSMPVEHFEAVRRASAYRSAVPVGRLHSYDQSIDIALTDTLASEFLDGDTKNTILGLLDESRSTIGVRIDEPAETKARRRTRLLATMALAASSIGVGVTASAGWLYVDAIQYGPEATHPLTAMSLMLVTLIAASLAVVGYLTRALVRPSVASFTSTGMTFKIRRAPESEAP